MQDNTPPDVIFLDLEMPYIDGYEALDMFKANPTWQNVPVVACTVHVSEFHAARDKPFHSFIGKPLNADQFTEHLKKILSGERVWDISSGSF
jgi:twitching motility two-component system response regulator PilH